MHGSGTFIGTNSQLVAESFDAGAFLAQGGVGVSISLFEDPDIFVNRVELVVDYRLLVGPSSGSDSDDVFLNHGFTAGLRATF